jgi:hypothetical protein
LNRVTYQVLSTWSSHQFGVGQGVTAARSAAVTFVAHVTQATGLLFPASRAAFNRASQAAFASAAVAFGEMADEAGAAVAVCAEAGTVLKEPPSSPSMTAPAAIVFLYLKRTKFSP